LPFLLALLGALAVFAAAYLGTGGILRYLRRHAILDIPTERSSHGSPTPRGGGIAVMAAIAAGWSAVALFADPMTFLVLALALALSAVSWREDVAGVPILWRLSAQALAVVVGLAALAPDALVWQGLFPFALDRALTALVWLWFVNLFNFMDGIDGISGVETAALGLGVALVAVIGGLAPERAAYGLILAAAGLGFLCWNWHPAKIFLGDVGSVGLGFLSGWLLLDLAASGFWAAALILPFYYLADASLTLIRRLLRGEKVWAAHKAHFYQQAARRMGTHARPVLWLLALDLGLLVLAGSSAGLPVAAPYLLFFAAFVTLLLLWYFAEPKPEA
jgi:UDP-N-acetylmuramyl pentapeptide phosphotransferase/UDP-N-acetylglucosamine-1-phosphate transferase